MAVSQVDIGMAMTEAIHRSRSCQALLSKFRGAGCTARFEFYVQCAQDELTRTFSAGPSTRLIQDIQDIREVLRDIANYNGARNDPFHVEVRPIVTASQQLIRHARRHPLAAVLLSRPLANAESTPRSDAATGSRSSSSLLRNAGVLTGWTTEESVAGMGEWSASEGDFHPPTLDILSEHSSEDTEDSGFVSQPSDATSTSENLRMLKK